MMLAVLLGSAVQVDPSALITIRVAHDRIYTQAHSITISPAAKAWPRSRAARDSQDWIAVRSWEGGSQTITSQACPALRTVALSVGDLAAVPVSPPSLRVVEGETLPIPPTIKDGFDTTLEFRTLNADGSETDVILSSGVDYQTWGHRAVSALIACWGPLKP